MFPFGLSVFFPAYNDAPSLPKLIEQTFAVLRERVRDYEVIVVNDGSADKTGEVLEQLRREYAPYLRIVTHSVNRGYGAALRSGFAAAAKEFVFYTDGDGQYDPGELAALLDAAQSGAGLVNGYKVRREDPWHRIAIGWLYNQFARRLFGIRLRDIDCDFRLIRRSLLQDQQLISTSGTICVELVRRIELSGAKVVELPVRHYPRLHGRSQFFRLQSLATTFLQLAILFWQLVLMPFWRNPRALSPGGNLSRRGMLLTVISVTLLSLLAYARSLGLPFIADDYVQIALARDYGPVSGWQALLDDALYRCRATSLILTYWTERWFGAESLIFSFSSLGIHILNGLLVFAMGVWRPIGWKVSAVAASFFAVSQRHHEAVIWYAALPELLVFFFGVASFLCWVLWIQSARRRHWAYFGSLACFVAALASKESAVVIPALLLLVAVWDARQRRAAVLGLVPFALCAVAYTWAIFGARETHLHFNDAGTFSLDAPFLAVLLRSAARLMRVWGFLALIALVVWRARRWLPLLVIAAVWAVVTFLPYSFLTYMPSVPSRHTYWASVGQALVIAAGFIEFQSRVRSKHRNAAAVAVAAVIVVYQCSYLWFWKQPQFVERAYPTAELVRIAGQQESPIYVTCFPYDTALAGLALKIEHGDGAQAKVVFGEASGKPGVNLCTAAAHSSN